MKPHWMRGVKECRGSRRLRDASKQHKKATVAGIMGSDGEVERAGTINPQQMFCFREFAHGPLATNEVALQVIEMPVTEMFEKELQIFYYLLKSDVMQW